MQQLPETFAAWRGYPQFILVQGKMPVGVDFKAINPHDPSNWMAADEAFAKADLLGLGVGFVFTASDPFWFIDLDHCIQGGQCSPIAQQLLNAFNGAAVEVSTSGDGLHIFGCGNAPEHSKKNSHYGIEFYTEGRYALLTGNGANGGIWLDWTQQLGWLVNTYFQPRVQADSLEWRDEPVPEWTGPDDDEVLIAKMLSSRGSAASVFGSKASLKDLWEGNAEALARSYPSQNDRDPYDRSSADAALASHLAFWTGKDHERIRQLMYQSALVRDKWENHPSYLERTITGAVDQCNGVYNPKSLESGETVASPSSSEPDPLSWINDFTVSQEEAEKLADPKWVYDNLVIEGHVSVFPAAPNAGKTTIFFQLAGEFVTKGYDVHYVNADISGGDAKEMIMEAREKGIKLLLPDLKIGKSMDNVVSNLEALNSREVELNNLIFIFDTLKKMTDVIQKDKSKNLYKLFRSLSGKGMTIILLAHTNKYNDEEGNPVFEGTGDLRADVDEMIYLIPNKYADEKMIVSTAPDKTRGKFQPITFEITADRDVRLMQKFVDTKLQIEKQKQLDKDKEVIEAINSAIQQGYVNQKEISDNVKKSTTYGVRQIRRVISTYSKEVTTEIETTVKAEEGIYWGFLHGDRNEKIYKILTVIPDRANQQMYVAPVLPPS